MEKQEKIFVKGMYFDRPREGAPDFIKGKISIKRADFVEFIKAHTDEWLNIDLKSSKEGKLYLELNQWKPTKKEEVTIDGVPF